MPTGAEKVESDENSFSDDSSLPIEAFRQIVHSVDEPVPTEQKNEGSDEKSFSEDSALVLSYLDYGVYFQDRG
jgi:hypothetical protein